MAKSKRTHRKPSLKLYIFSDAGFALARNERQAREQLLKLVGHNNIIAKAFQKITPQVIDHPYGNIIFKHSYGYPALEWLLGVLK